MAEVFGNQSGIRGCFMVYTYNSSGGRGAQLMMPGGTPLPSSSPTDPLIVTGFGGSQREAVTFMPTFGGRVYTFAFGHDPTNSSISVQFLGFLVSGTVAGGGGGGRLSSVTDTVMKSYNKSRVSVTGKYARLSLGRSKPVRGFVLGMGTETGDPEINVQRFTVMLGLAEVQ